jgi:MYXO-CTERM domain-containing protein
MKQPSPPIRRATGLLLAAAALPLAPLLAQDASSATQPETVDVTPPPAPDPQPADTPEPAAAEPDAPVADTSADPAPAATSVPRAAPRAPVRVVRSAPIAPTVEGPAPISAFPDAAVPVTVPAPAGEAGAVDPLAIEELPEPEVLPPPATTVEPTRADEGGGAAILWVIGGLALAALAYLLLRRRRRHDTIVHKAARDETVYDSPAPAPVRAAPVEPAAAAPVAAAPVAAAPVTAAPLAAAAAPVATAGTIPAFRSFAAEPPAAEPPAAAAAIPLDAGEPRLDLLMHPVRAGVTEGEARVEFALAVENQGSAPARDVRVSTFLVAAGPGRESEMERLLIEHGAASRASDLPEVTIEPGSGQRIETAVSLPTGGLGGDAVLPVVVAEARFRRPDGSEGRTSASFAVGVPDGEELAHFAVDRPSGLHEGVVARELGETERS